MAGGIKFTASSTRNPVQVGENFQVDFAIENGSVRQFINPNFAPFQVIQGPIQGTRINVGMNGATQTLTLSYILRATKEGRFTIPPATAVTNAGNIESNSFVVQVNKAAPSQPSAGSNNNVATNGADLSKNVFIRITADKNSVYEGEQVTVTYKVYTNVAIVGSQVTKVPSFNGCWNQEYKIPEGVSGQEVINGTTYNVLIFKRVALFPQHAGTLVLDPAEIKILARVKSKNKRQSIIDQMFGNNPMFNDPFFNDPMFNDPFFNGYEDIPYVINSGSLKINVKPLPPNKPADFNGAVGRFTITAKADKTKLSTDDAITYRVQISGTGNLPTFEAPTFIPGEDFETYDPKTLDAWEKEAYPISGSKSFEYVIIPNESGKIDIDGAHFSYFDLDKQAYVTLKTALLSLDIAEGKHSNSAKINGQSREELKLSRSDVKPLLNAAWQEDWKRVVKPFWGSFLFYLLMSIPIILALLLFIFRKNGAAILQRYGNNKEKQAIHTARKYLKQAQDSMKSNNTEAFYQSLERCMWTYFAQKWSMNTQQQNRSELSNLLNAHQVGENLQEQINSLLNECEMALYAPGAVSVDFAQKIKAATDLIIHLENDLKQ